MKRLLSFLVLSLMLVQIPVVSGNDIELEITEPTKGQLFFDDSEYEYRSMWCEGYQIINISEVKAVVEYARKYNFNCISPLINGDWRGVFYNSSYFPRHPDIAWHFDPLMELIKEAHKYGIQVHPWWHTLFSYPILREHPEWRTRSSSGSYSWYWINPAIPEAREYVRDVTLEVVKNYPIEGIKLDTIRYGGSTYSYDDYTLQKYADSGMTDFNAFRRLQITETVELIYDSLMEVKPWFWVGADVFSSSWGRLNGVFQEPESWFSKGIIDYVTPMIYTTSETSYNSSITYDIDNVGGPVVGGTYVYIPGNTAHGSVPNETVGMEKLVNMVSIAQDQGAWGICAFAYKFLREYPSYGQALKEDPFSHRVRCPIKEQDIPTQTSRWYFETDHDTRGWNLFDSGHFYPFNGVWSISRSREPKLLSPRINITASGTNVIEISALIEENVNCTLKIYWGQMAAVLDDNRMIERPVTGTGDWNIYSIHLDKDPRWMGVITYLTVVPVFGSAHNITIDQITLHWMPYCIREVSYLGPFTVGGDEDLLDMEFIEDEGGNIPRRGDIDSGREWSSYFMERDLIDFRFPLGRSTYTVVYSHVLVKSGSSRQVQFRIGSSDGVKVWLNGDPILSSYEARSVSPDQNVTATMLNEGFNSLFIKHAVYTGQFSTYIRFTDLENNTLDDLEYFSDIPYPSEPVIENQGIEWYSTDSVEFSWYVNETFSKVVSYEVRLDDHQTVSLDSTSIRMENMENGDHTLYVRCIDELGEKSETSSVRFGIDTVDPLISDPSVPGEYSTNGTLIWDWELMETPVSGIKRFEVLISHGPADSQGTVEMEPLYIEETQLILKEGVLSGHKYYARVKAVSNSGRYHISGNSDPVIVDTSAPTRSEDLRTYMIDRTNRTYRMEWEPSRDDLGSGLEGYSIFLKDDNGDWDHYLESNYNSFIYTRPLGIDPVFRIIAHDKAGNLAPPSEEFKLPNQIPVAHFDRDIRYLPGEPIRIGSGLSYDPDGAITGHLWKIDGETYSMENNLTISLEEGIYDMELTVFDDRGANDSLRASVVISYDEGTPGMPLRSWMINISIKDHVLPVINITIPLYPEPEPDEPDPLVEARSDVITVGSAVFAVVFFLSLVISIMFNSTLMRKKKFSKMYDDEFIIEEEAEIEDVTIETEREKIHSSDQEGIFMPAPGMDRLGPVPFDKEPGAEDQMVFEEEDIFEEDDILEEDEFLEEEYIEDWDDIEVLEEFEDLEEVEEFEDSLEDELYEVDDDENGVWL